MSDVGLEFEPAFRTRQSKRDLRGRPAARSLTLNSCGRAGRSEHAPRYPAAGPKTLLVTRCRRSGSSNILPVPKLPRCSIGRNLFTLDAAVCAQLSLQTAAPPRPPRTALPRPCMPPTSPSPCSQTGHRSRRTRRAAPSCRPSRSRSRTSPCCPCWAFAVGRNTMPDGAKTRRKAR